MIQVFLSLCDVFCALINSFVCWFCIGTLGLMLFHIVFVLYLSIQPTRHLFGQTGTMISLAKLVSFSWFLGAEDSGRAEETGVAQPQGGECGGVPRTGATHHYCVSCSEQSAVPYHGQQVWHWLSSEWQGKTDVPRTRVFITNTQSFYYKHTEVSRELLESLVKAGFKFFRHLWYLANHLDNKMS